ncbi:uncharacterized protein LOC18427447 isoform X1 [Amborella trichopoda]|uniref:uncharacterized protein LOC18427447 isoform X1 n=2 Tax=Amborella trichopoda TaxID=13333 RepID=UPI0009BCDF03|nr:uncharacterized protein LOC18427447 isoform X1 [Amborella trichopoda]|eukprot:XP_020518817.1 uncharacterized protein LOC18427447 isoform X1 [Amborella trichopoda]
MSDYRVQLEQDVKTLQRQLKGEIDLHIALESAVGHDSVPLSTLACQLPDEVRELFVNIAMLEHAVSKLEEEMGALQLQLIQERNERRLAEYHLRRLPSSSRLPHSPVNWKTSQLSPSRISRSNTSQLHCSSEPDLQYNYGDPHVTAEPDLCSLEKQNPVPCTTENQGRKGGVSLMGKPEKDVIVVHLWHYPNHLSEEMVQCMKDIFICLADSSKSSSSETMASPVSPHGHPSVSSFSSSSGSSSKKSSFDSSSSYIPSLMRSPSVEINYSSGVFGMEKSFDPYRVPEKLSWAHIGNYSSAVEVSWMSVGKKQLEYAAEALRRFRSLVEQLAKVNPACMTCNEKVAFWINVYNALIMHAYLAYGVPRSDLKLLSLMQKASYTVGGHSFSAAAIEYIILKMQPPVHRPQVALVLALHKSKIPEEQSKYAVESAEPLVAFALSCGMYSSPAVRIFTADNVREELKNSLKDYVQASVGINNKGKLLVPKMLHSFAKTIVEEALLSEWICQFLPSHQAAVIQDCIRQRRQRFLGSRNCYAILPFDSRFRYLFLPESRNSQSPH